MLTGTLKGLTLKQPCQTTTGQRHSWCAAGAMSWIILVFGLELAGARLTGETEIDIDEDHGWDIIKINEAAGLDLLEGDIAHDETLLRNTRKNESFRWPTTVPYYLEDSLEMNAKGMILKVFDEYRLKTCIDFKPWNGEKNYISVYKDKGCFSHVGNYHMGKQPLSIGSGCDYLGTVEHEFLHALGFWHEQSRADRDDYVSIMWDQIESDKKNNFELHDDSESSALGVPYDYGSVMHYPKTAFSIGSEPTIITKVPQFQDVIGQRTGFSMGDLTKLNRLYSCTTSSTFVDSCNFEEENICGMIQDSCVAQWVRRNFVISGPWTDFTYMGKYKGKGYFMHVRMAFLKRGQSALLKSRWLFPKPGVQCLQFFLYNSGAASDVLNIYVQEYDKCDPCGKKKLLKSISGGVTGSWELHKVNFTVTNKTRMLFEGVRGMKPSMGGFSLDDLNLSAKKCPDHIWHIRSISNLLATTPVGRNVYSPRFLSPSGYTFQPEWPRQQHKPTSQLQAVQMFPNGQSYNPGYLAAYFHLTSGPNDDKLKWPCPWHQATMALMDQQSDIREGMNMNHMITTDPNRKAGTQYFWDNPSKVGSEVTDPDGSVYYRGPGLGSATFISHSTLKSRNYIKGDDAYFLLSLEDISDLLKPQPLPHSAVHADADLMVVATDQEAADNVAVVSVMLASAAVVMLVVSMVMVGVAWMMMKKGKKTESDKEVLI
ncbi:meprin A subunit beta-like isoform 3-T3 [Pholidichthys leucotaenia]